MPWMWNSGKCELICRGRKLSSSCLRRGGPGRGPHRSPRELSLWHHRLRLGDVSKVRTRDKTFWIVFKTRAVYCTSIVRPKKKFFFKTISTDTYNEVAEFQSYYAQWKKRHKRLHPLRFCLYVILQKTVPRRNRVGGGLGRGGGAEGLADEGRGDACWG